MMRGAAAWLIPALAVAPCTSMAFAQSLYTVLPIEIHRSNPDPVRPTAPINTLRDLQVAFAGCWSPPPLDSEHAPVDLTFQVSFKRSGELFGKPRAIHFARQVTDKEREIYYRAVAEAVERCAQMPFTEAMGGAAAGRQFRINFRDRRNSKQTEGSWRPRKS
jgi:hypothetical protein